MANTTTTIVTDHAQTVDLTNYLSGDGVNFVDLNGKLVDFDYEKSGADVELSTSVSFYATVKVNYDKITDGDGEYDIKGLTILSYVNKTDATDVITKAQYDALGDSQKEAYKFNEGTLTLDLGKFSDTKYYFMDADLYNNGTKDVKFAIDLNDMNNIQAGNFHGANGFYAAYWDAMISHYGSEEAAKAHDIKMTDLHIYQVVNGGEPIDVTTNYRTAAADPERGGENAYNQGLYGAQENDITVTIKNYADPEKANTDIIVNEDETHDGLNLAEAEYPVVAKGDYAATWLKEDITVVGDAVISDSYEGDSIFFKDLSGDAIKYTATKVGDDVKLSTNISYYATVYISPNVEAKPYVSDNGTHYEMKEGLYTAHLALVNTGAAAGHYMWKVDTKYGTVGDEDRYCFFGIGGDSFNFGEDGNVTSIDPDTFSGLTYEFKNFYEVVNGDTENKIDVTKGYYDVVKDVDDWETLYAAHQGLFESQGDLTATLDKYATNAYAGESVYVNGDSTTGDDLATEVYAVNASGSYTATWLKEAITSTADTVITFNAETAAGDSLVFGLGAELSYSRDGNNLVITNSADEDNIITTTIKNYYTSGDMSVAGAYKDVKIDTTSADTTLGDLEVTNIENVSDIIGTDAGEVISLVEGTVNETDDVLSGNTYTSRAGYGNVTVDAYAAGKGGEDIIAGTEGNDWINGGADDDAVFGGAGEVGSHDMLSGGTGDDLVVAGEIVAEGTPGAINIGTPEDPQYVLLTNGTAELYGDAGNDKLIGGAGADYIRGDAGNDTLTGNGGADVFAIDSGNDVITDATSADVIKFVDDYRNDFTGITFAKGEGEKATSLMVSFGENSSVEIQNYFNVDGTVAENHVNTFALATSEGTKEFTLEWHYSNVDKEYHMYNVTHNPNGAAVEGIRNWINGYYNGNLEIKGANAGDMLAGSIKNDKIDASDGGSELYGDAGDDLLIGGAGNDYIEGGSGDDDLYGYGGNDKLITRDGTDKAYGGSGDDHFFIDGAGTKTIEGEGGADTYHIIDLSAVSNITADADDNITFDYSNYKFSDLKFTRNDEDLVISFEKTGNDGSINVKGFFTAESKIDTIKALNDENTPELTTYSILNNADIYVDLTQVDGAYQATDYKEVFYGEGTVNGFKNAKDSVESASPVLARTNNSTALTIDDITINNFDFDANKPFAIRDGLMSTQSTDYPINVTLSDNTEYQATGYAEKISGVGSVNLEGEHPFDRSKDSIVVADVDDVKFTREDNGNLVVKADAVEYYAKIEISANGGAVPYISDEGGQYEVAAGEHRAVLALSTVGEGAGYYWWRLEPEYGTFDGEKHYGQFGVGGVDFNFDEAGNVTSINADTFDGLTYQFKGFYKVVNGVETDFTKDFYELVKNVDSIETMSAAHEALYNEESTIQDSIAVKGFNFAGGTDFNVTDGETTILTEGQTIDVTLTGSDYVSAAGYAERITTTANSSVRFYPEGEYTGQDTLVFDTDDITYKRNGDDLVITYHPDVENEISTTVLDYYKSDNMAEEGQFARAQVSAGEINTTLGDLEVSYIENVSSITGTDNEEAIELVTTTGVIPQNASGDFPNYDGETGKYTSNVLGNREVKIDAYAAGMGGDDLINGTAGNDWINGGDGGDTIYGGTSGKDMLAGGDGENIILAGDFSGATPTPNTDGVEIYGGKDKDTIYAGGLYSETENYIWAHGGNDEIHLYGGKNTIMLIEEGENAKAGNDTIYGATSVDTLKFVSRDGDGDVISGYDFDDLTFAKDGDDLTITVPDGSVTTLKNFFDAYPAKVDTILTADRTEAHSIKNEVVFDVVLENGESFDKATSGYGDYIVSISGEGKVKNLGEADMIAMSGTTEYSFNDKGLLVEDGTNEITIIDNTTGQTANVYVNDEADDITGKTLTVTKLNNFDASSLGYKNVEITGTGSADNFTGSAGNDTISGKAGADVIDGGTGADTFMYEANGTSFGHDTIKNATLDDKISFSTIISQIGFGPDGMQATVTSTAHFEDLVFEKSGNDLMIKIKDNTADDIKVEGFFTAESKINKIEAAVDGVYSIADFKADKYMKEYSIKDDAVINVALANNEDWDKTAAGCAGYTVKASLLEGATHASVTKLEDGDELVTTTETHKRSGDDLVLDAITVKNYYASGDMSVDGRYEGVIVGTGTLGALVVTDIENVSYFDSGSATTDRDETVELTTGLEVGDIDPDKLALDTAGKVRINTTTEKYEYTSSAGYGTVALDAYALGRAGEDTITGTAGNDWINGGADDDAVFGGAGAAGSHDMLSGHDGDDLVVAGEIVEEGTPGAINIGTPDDPQYVLLSDGNAEMYGGIGNDILFGGNANDYLDGGAGNDTLVGNAGNDKLISDAGDDEMYGGEGDDKFFIDGAGTKTVEGGDGNDTFNIIDTNAVVTIADATSADKISFAYLGTGFNFNNLDFAQAENEKDLVISYKNITGAMGKVVVEGYFDQAEANRLTTFNVGGTEYTLKWLHSNTAKDYAMYNVTVNPDGATVEGIRNWVSGSTNESVTIVGKDQYDMLAGGQNGDIITAGENSNGAELYGDAGDDILTGGAGNDYIQGDGNYVPVGGDDILYGMGGDDKLITDDGDDEVYGGDGDDQIIINGEGIKYVEGGDGKDTYNIIDLTADVEIADAEAADTLSFHYNQYKFSNLIFTRLGDDLTITFAGMDEDGSVLVDDFFASETPIDKVVAYDKNGVEQTYSILEDATILVNLDQFEGETYTATDYTELFTATEPASVKGLKEDDIILNGDETVFTRANGGPLVINDLITVEDFFTTGLDVDFTVNGESTEDANIAVTLSDGFVYNSTRYDETISGNGYVMGMDDGDALAIDGEVEYSRINGGGLTVSGFTGELLNDKITVMDFAFINDGDHDINVNGDTTANATIKVTIKNDYTYDATSYPEVISGEGFVKGLTADDSIVDGTSTEFARFNDGGLIINGNIEVLDFFENGVDFKVNGVSTEHANIDVVLDDCDYTATRYAETISGTGYVTGMDAAKDKLVVDEVSYARENNGGLLVGGQLLVTDFDFTGGHDIKVNEGTTEGMTIDVTLNGIIGAPYESASGYAERITTNASTAIQFAENSDKDTLVFNTSADNLDYARDGKDLIITNGDVVTTVLGYYNTYNMSGQFSNVAVDTTTTDTTLGALEVTDIVDVSVIKGTNKDDIIALTKIDEDETIKQSDIFFNDVPHYDEETGEYTSNFTGESYKLETYANGMAGDDAIYGTDGNDWINGSYGDDVIFGGAGDADSHDMLSGGEDNAYGYGIGHDVVIAGEEVNPGTEGAVQYRGIVDDSIYTVKLTDGSTEMYGMGGNDLLVGGNGDDIIIADDFSVTAADGNDTVYANGGDDHIRTGAGNDTIYAGEGDDNIRVTGSGTKDIYGEDGIDTIDVRDLTAVINLKDATSADKLDFSKVENFGFNNMAFAKAGKNLEITYTELLGATGKVVVEGYFDQAEANRLTTFNVGGTEYTLKWLADGDGNYAMYNYTDDPTKLVDGIQNWIEDEDPIDPESGIGTLVPGKDKRDVIYGTEYKDIISAGEGGAEIYGLEGDDFIYGSEKDDYIAGGEGNDSIYLDGDYAGGSDVIALVNPEGTLKAIGEDTIYGATANTTLLFSLGDGNGYKFNELEFNRVGDNLEIIAGTANDNPNKVIIDGFFTADSRVNAIYALDANGSEALFTIYMDAEINVDLSQFEGTYHATAFDEVFTGSGSVEGMDEDFDRIVVDGTPVYTRTDNGGLTISTYSESGSLVNEITVEDFDFTGEHDITVNEGTTAGMTIGVKLTDALDGTYIAAAYAENITVTAENPVNVRGLDAEDNLEIGNKFKFSRVFVGDDSGNDDILTITTEGGKVVNVEAYDFTQTPAFTIGNTPIMIDAPLDVTAKADYACSGAFSETVLVDGAIKVTGFNTEKDALLFNEDAETTYALDKFAGLTISDGEGHSVTIEGIDTEADIIPANVGTFDDYEEDYFGRKTLKVSGYSVYDGSEPKTAFGSLDITGTLGSDTLKGSAGNDIIDGLADNDILTGGKGADTFVISAGTDDITDANAEDDIKFAGYFDGLEATRMETSLLIQSKDKDGNEIAVEIENYFDENGKVVADAVDTLYALNAKGEYAEYSIADIRSGETYIDFTDYEFSDLTFKRNVNGEHPNDLVITAGNEIKVFENYFTDKNPEDNVRTKDGKFSVLADAEIIVTQGEDGYTGTKYNETINTGIENQTFDMKTGVDTLNFTFESCGTETEPDFVMGDFIVKVTKGEQMFLNVPDTITVGATTFDVLQEFTVEGKDLVINVRYNSNEFITGADPEYEHLGSITVKDAAGKNTGADIYVRNDGEFENVNSHPFIEFTEAEVTDKNTLTGSTLADNIDVSHYITENGKGVKIDSKSGSDVIVGSNYNDTVKASSLEGEFATVTEYGGTNKITTGKGNDVINAYDYSSNTINAGAGNNAITLNSVGKNTVTAKDGNNYIEIDEGSNSVKVGKGNNLFDINAGTNTIKTGAGKNTFFVENGVNKITSGKNQDRFYIEGGNNTISSGAGEDRFSIEGGSNTIKTGNAASWFYLAERADENDTVYVNNITSGSKNDTFIISDGQNNIKSGSGVDKFYIGYTVNPLTDDPEADDTVNGGYNVINGGAGEDVFFINSGKNALNGAKGNDRYEVDLTDFNFNAGQIVITDTAGKNTLNAIVGSDETGLDTLNVFFDVTVKTNKAGTKFKGASYSDMTFTTDVAGADGFDDLDGIDVSSKKALTYINTYDKEGEGAVTHSAEISTKELDKLASDVAGWLFNKGYASTDDVFANEKNEGDIAELVAKYTTFSANDYKMQ